MASLTFWAFRAHFSETSDAAYRFTHSQQVAPLAGAYPHFWPFVYVLENALLVVRLGRASTALRGHGIAIDGESLAHLSPIGWEHVNLTGDYIW